MSKNLQSPTKLTEFPPLEPEERQQTVGQFISRLFKLGKSAPNHYNHTSNLEQSSDYSSQENLPSWAVEQPENGDTAKEGFYQMDINERRSLPNVLKRISNLIALKSTNLQAYSDTDLKQYWMPDSVSKECYECSEKFTTFRRRHHCRVCGQIFCSQCCNQQIPGKIFGCTGDLRVCNYCSKIVLSYLQSSDAGTDLTADLKALQESLQNKYGNLSPLDTPSASSSLLITPSAGSLEIGNNTLRRKVSVGYQEEKFGPRGSENEPYLSPEEKCKVLQSSVSLRNLYEEVCKPTTGVPLQTQRYRLRNHPECFMGSDLVDWLIYQQKANTRIQAAAICQAFLDGNYIECLSESFSFVDGYAIYKFGNISNEPPITASSTFDLPNQDEPSWIQQIPQESSTTDSESDQLLPHIDDDFRKLQSSHSYTLDLNIEANTVYLAKPSRPMYSPDDELTTLMCEEPPVVQTSEQRGLVPASGWYNVQNLREENEERLAYNLLTEGFKQHKENLLRQLLSAHGVSVTWSETILPLVDEIVNTVRPDKNHNAVSTDIRHYVRFKKVSGGTRADSVPVFGVVCSKNVAHKKMASELENPKILLLDCSLVYQRTEGKLMSLEPIIMQEQEYLRHVVTRIVVLKPDVILVQKSVSRLVQDLLRDQGITVVLNVKQSILERLAKCMDADIVTSMDAHIGRPRLGNCKQFYLKTYQVERGDTKTLMFFDSLPSPHLGATVLLRGASKAELTKIKKVATFFLFVCYNWRLEKSFLMDEFAQPPNHNDSFFDESNESSPVLAVHAKPINEHRLTNGKVQAELFPDEENDVEVFKKAAQTNRQEMKCKKEKPISVASVGDFDDPLLSGNLENVVNNSVEKFSVAELPFFNDFRKALNGTILCISPYLVFTIPYLESEMGRKCKLRIFFPDEIYYSSQIGPKKKIKLFKDGGDLDEDSDTKINKKLKPPHAFTIAKIRTNVNDNEFQASLAHFRACGGRLEYKSTLNLEAKEEIESRPNSPTLLDVLDPFNQQHLMVLFCSFCHCSHNAPAFCVKLVVCMEFYGVNDIPLGSFLQRYCFQPTYECASKTCDTPMLKHIRRFVHNGGCLSLTLSNFEKDFSEDNIVMWNWCSKCQRVSPVVPMSTDTWSFSFAKYLELRFHGGMFTRRGSPGCPHSLHHDHFQYFGYKNIVASFNYSPIKLWEISLPPLLMKINYNTAEQQTNMIEEIKTLALKGHEVYATVNEKLALIPGDVDVGVTLKQILIKEQELFKQKIEEVQIKLTSPTLESKTFEDIDNKEVIGSVWRAEDSITRVKRIIADGVEQWNLKFAEYSKKKDVDKKKERTVVSSDLDSPTTPENKCIADSLEKSVNENGIPCAKRIQSLDHSDVSEEFGTPPSPKSHQRSQSEGTVLHNDETHDVKRESDKKTMKNIISQFLQSPAPITPVQSPFGNQDHYSLPTGVVAPLAVFENEPSSVVAYALNSFDYKKALDEITGKKSSSGEPSPSPVPRKKHDNTDAFSEKANGLLSFLRSKDHKNDLLSSTNSDCIVAEEQSITSEKNVDANKSKTTHIEVQFLDSNSNFFCRIYFAEKFASLRNILLPDGEEAYIRSLSRCIQWNARGGKSGSTFCKTRDDRFVLKQVQKLEVQLFLEFAPNYFVYIEKCISTGQPTLLGKIVGIYQVVYRNTSTSATLRTNLLVMENLFYNRRVTHKFDLKGSMRNRMVNPDNQDGEIVLLDENLLKMTCDAPLYILPHSKEVLTAAIQNDIDFLSKQSVMDYSLLVGLDSDHKELVLGIIDYIRTFTWDKRLEAVVKKSGLLGGQGKLPTIISPQEYRNRFIEAMHKYFLMVPDHWTGIGKDMEC